jgi:hypothetical protein
MSTFQLSGLDPVRFQSFFAQSDEELKSQGVERRVATAQPGFPCRVSLQDAEVGDELLLLPYRHHDVGSPYQSLGPIFVRKGARKAIIPPGAIPEYLSRRLLSIRAYDERHMMVDAAVCQGIDVANHLDGFFGNLAVSYIHLHNAKQGCFLCLASRADGP